MAGWEHTSAWLNQTLGIEDLPGAVNPQGGFPATANNKPLVADERPFIAHDFIDGYRVAGITERPANKDDWTVPAAGGLQLDRSPIPRDGSGGACDL